MLNICSNRTFYVGVIYIVCQFGERTELLELKCVESRCFCFFAFVNFLILIKSEIWDFSNSPLGDLTAR